MKFGSSALFMLLWIVLKLILYWESLSFSVIAAGRPALSTLGRFWLEGASRVSTTVPTSRFSPDATFFFRLWVLGGVIALSDGSYIDVYNRSPSSVPSVWSLLTLKAVGYFSSSITVWFLVNRGTFPGSMCSCKSSGGLNYYCIFEAESC